MSNLFISKTPWRCLELTNDIFSNYGIFDSDGRPIAYTNEVGDLDTEENNGELMAIAPEMRDLLEEILEKNIIPEHHAMLAQRIIKLLGKDQEVKDGRQK